LPANTLSIVFISRHCQGQMLLCPVSWCHKSPNL